MTLITIIHGTSAKVEYQLPMVTIPTPHLAQPIDSAWQMATQSPLEHIGTPPNAHLAKAAPVTPNNHQGTPPANATTSKTPDSLSNDVSTNDKPSEETIPELGHKNTPLLSKSNGDL